MSHYSCVLLLAFVGCASAPPVCVCKFEPAAAVASVPAPAPAPAPTTGPMTRAAARSILRALSPDDRATLDELWFMYELHDAVNNEGQPQRLLRRVETVFARPVVADPVQMQAAIDEARRLFAAIPDGTAGSDWAKTAKVIAPVVSEVLERSEIERRLLAFPEDVALAWLVDQFHSPDHYHRYNMANHLFDLVTTTFGRRALPVVEARLRESTLQGKHHFLGKYWNDATHAAQAILGAEFDRWYRRIRASSYDEDLVKQQEAEVNYFKSP